MKRRFPNIGLAVTAQSLVAATDSRSDVRVFFDILSPRTFIATMGDATFVAERASRRQG
jgi:hypothetical protein